MTPAIIDVGGRHALPQQSLTATLEAMDRAGVGRMVASAWLGPARVAISNDAVARLSANSGGRLIGVGSVDISRPKDAAREVRRCVGDLGLRAIRVRPWLWDAPPTDRRLYPVYAACAEEGAPVCADIGEIHPLARPEVGEPMGFGQVATDFPDLAIVASHIGPKWTSEAVSVAAAHPNFHIETSANALGRHPTPFISFMRAAGAAQVLFGANHPALTLEESLEGLDELGLPTPILAKFLSGNAKRVFHLEQPPLYQPNQAVRAGSAVGRTREPPSGVRAVSAA